MRLGRKRVYIFFRALHAGIHAFFEATREITDDEAFNAGRSIGGIYGKPAAEALTPDNHVAELYNPAVFEKQDSSLKQLGSFVAKFFRRLEGVCLRLRRSILPLAALLILVPPVNAASNPGQVVGWNHAATLMTNIPPGLTNAIAVAGSGFSYYALKSDGTVIAWGNNQSGQTNVPPGLSNVIAIAPGGIDNLGHCLALKSDGTVTAWGNNTHGQTNVPTGLSNVVAVAAGLYQSLALKSDGTLAGWGAWTGASVVPVSIPSGLSNVAAVAGGDGFSVAVKSDGTVAQWGIGQTNVPPGLTNLVAIAAGEYHCVGLRSDGTVISWGSNPYNQTNTPAGLSNVIAVAAGSRHSMALKNDGTVVAWGYQENVPGGITNVVSIAGAGNANGSYSLAISINLVVQDFTLSGSNPTFRFHTFAGQHYLVETTSNLTSGVWLPVAGGDIQGNGQDVVLTDTNASGNLGFYRVKQGE